METKICSKCGEEKDIEEFNICNRNKCGRQSWCKECKRENGQKNKQHIAKMNKIYRERNKERIRITRKKYREENKLTISIRKKEYYTKNKQKVYAYLRKYYKTPAGKINKAKDRHNRREAYKKLERSLTSLHWEIILESQKNKCSICGKRFCKSRPPTIDHIIPLSKGGGLTFENVQALCHSCNSKKRSKLDHSKLVTWGIYEHQ